MVGYRRFEGLEAATLLAQLYRSARLLVNFFQPSFKLIGKQRGALRNPNHLAPGLRRAKSGAKAQRTNQWEHFYVRQYGFPIRLSRYIAEHSPEKFSISSCSACFDHSDGTQPR
jgi:hypothetical protein